MAITNIEIIKEYYPFTVVAVAGAGEPLAERKAL